MAGMEFGLRGALRSRGMAGITVIELIMAIGVLAVALLSLVTVLASSGSLQQSTREKALAYNAARQKIEEMRNRPLNEVYRAFNGRTSDDIVGVVCPGKTFTVAGLVPQGSRPVGEIVFPENSSGLLDERIVDPTLGMPKDLTGDGDADEVENAAVSSPHRPLTDRDYRILPVKIVVRWMSVGKKAAEIEVATFITDK